MTRLSQQTVDAIVRRLRQIPRPSRVAQGPGRRQRFDGPAPFRIVSSTKQGASNRWVYTARRLVKSSAGYGGWADHPTDTEDYTLYNSLEDQNGSSGTYGNGVSQENLNAVGVAMELQPIPDGARVFAIRVTVSDGTPEWWVLNLPNGVDGTCA